MAFPTKLTIMSLFAAMIMLSTSPFCTIARELRPADHGLGYQASPPSGHNMSPQMMSFFGSSASASASSSSSTWSSSSPPAPALALPTAMDSTNPSWMSNGGGGGGVVGGGGKRDHVKQVLIVGTMVCGFTGLCFLAVSAVIFVLKSRRAQPTTTLGDVVVSGDPNTTTK